MLRDNDIEVFTDGAMDRDTNRTGGTGFIIRFPEFLDVDDIEGAYRRDRQDIHRLEMIAILEAMHCLKKWFKQNPQHALQISGIRIHTDRHSISDDELLNEWKIAAWRRGRWRTYEGKPVKHKDLIDPIDKARKKLREAVHGPVEIQWVRRKNNKSADKLSKLGKREGTRNKVIVSEKGTKVAKRLFDGDEIHYGQLVVGEELDVRIYLKDPVQREYELSAEICDGQHFGKKLKIYVSFIDELDFHRHHSYRVKVKEVRKHHIRIMPYFEEIPEE